MQRCGERVARGLRAAMRLYRNGVRRYLNRAIGQVTFGATLATVAALVSVSIARPAAADTVDVVMERAMSAALTGTHATYVDYLFAEARKRDPAALYVIGSMLEHGTFGAPDARRALTFYAHAAELGFAKAQIAIGDLDARINGGNARAVPWYLEAAAQDDPEAHRKLGLAYLLGQEVPRDIDKAIAWLTTAARRGDAVAKRILGHVYHKGIHVPKNPGEALEWYYRAAQDGDDVAQYHYGQMAATGEATLKNFGEAAYWLHRSAAQGNAKAMLALGILYLGENGFPEERNPVQAYRWLSRAAENGSPEAAGRKAALAATMSPRQAHAAGNGTAVPALAADKGLHMAGRP